MSAFDLRSFDSTQVVRAKVVRPETYRQLEQFMVGEGALIARGAGLSLTAASFGEGVTSIDLTRFDRILAYDDASGTVEVESGLPVGALASFLAARGRHVPAMPGYPGITVGGAIALDVHGKSQPQAGNFGAWVESFDLHNKSHGPLRCSREQNADVFALTLGAAGLTGIITRARLRTVPLPAANIELRRVAARDLIEAAELMRAQATDSAGVYSWHDLNRSGANFGAGVVFVQRFTDATAARPAPKPAFDINTRFRMGLWNGASAALAARLYAARERSRTPTLLALQAALFPITGKERYYASFGPRGFREYQLIVPFAQFADFTRALAPAIRDTRVAVPLCSLKLMRGEPMFLRFAGDGVCLTLDVPAGPRADALFAAIDQLALASRCTVNIAKDSRLPAALCQQLFPEYGRFRAELARLDPEQHYRSQLRARIDC